jgi:chloramphenicol O-acetyltransferase type A
MYSKIDKSNWVRKEHFEFFSKYDEPFFGVVAEIDCTIAFKRSKTEKLSFFALYLWNSLHAANQIEEFKTRIRDDAVILHDKIHASPTIGRSDGTFAFSYVDFDEDFTVFNQGLKDEISAVQNSEGLRFPEGDIRDDIIHYSSLPWHSFTGLTHARNFKIIDSVPKITFGKAHEKQDKLVMSVAINAHHGLADCLHVSKFLDIFQDRMNG